VLQRIIAVAHRICNALLIARLPRQRIFRLQIMTTSSPPTSPAPKQTPLFDQHVALDARMVDFGGWHLPVNYGSQIEEHLAVRKSAGIFDVSHMTVWDIEGDETIPYLRKILANDIDRVSNTPGKAIYSCLLNETGGVIDDLIAYYLSSNHCRVVTNAGPRNKVKKWLLEQAKNFTVNVVEQPELALIAVQGPDALKKFHQAVGPLVREPVADLKKFCSIQISEWFIGRTGYTGENGIEVILPNRDAAGLWDSLINVGLQPCGLGARDTLRLEAGLSLYGNDLDEQHSPLESGLLWTVSLQDHARKFIGRRALEDQMQSSHKQLVGLVLEDRGVLRGHQKVLINGRECGEITSGTWSPSLEKSIALARISGDAGNKCSVEIRKKPVAARIVPVPFIKNGVSQVGK
jgi:aminomethyltransferase